MARGNEIIVTADPKGQFDEGFVAAGQTFYPGMIVQRDPTVSLIGGAHTYKLYDRGASGDRPQGALWVVTNLLGVMIGKTNVDSIAAGGREMFYSPRAGEEINLLVANLTGTADDHAAGEILIVSDAADATRGKLIATASTPESEVAQLLEAITDPVADTLAWCEWSGH